MCPLTFNDNLIFLVQFSQDNHFISWGHHFTTTIAAVISSCLHFLFERLMFFKGKVPRAELICMSPHLIFLYQCTGRRV